MPARRCSICALDWPQTDAYKACPSCLEPTSRIRNVDAMLEDEAKSMKSKLDFERFYEDWDSRHDSERLNPALAGGSHPGNKLASIHRPEKPA